MTSVAGILYWKNYFGSLDTQSVVVGGDGSAGSNNRRRGYISATFGGVTDGTANVTGGNTITLLYWDENGAGGVDFIQMQVGGSVPNSGWTSMTVNSAAFGGMTLTRASAAYFTGATTSWVWNNQNLLIGAQPFGPIGNNIFVAYN